MTIKQAFYETRRKMVCWQKFYSRTMQLAFPQRFLQTQDAYQWAHVSRRKTVDFWTRRSYTKHNGLV